MSMVEESRKVPLPMTHATIMSFGVAARKKLLGAGSTSAADKKKLATFAASEKWAKNLISRHGMASAPHGKAGSVDEEVSGEDMEAIREETKKYDLNNIFNVDETGIFRLLPNRTCLSKVENRKTASGTMEMKAKDGVSAYIGINATGTVKIEMSIIGKSKSSRCFR